MTTPAGTPSAARRNAHDPQVVTAGAIVLSAIGLLVVLHIVFRHSS
ncbi:MAG: hypothetical protein JWO67_21 [Streptosporangiaceae bacterium]|nr:hypothetical protein [Streptosporangiaceae bacterium]